MDTFLGRALTDPATGLPNLPYFCLIQHWEERRARRRASDVCVICLHVHSGTEEARRALTIGLCQELRSSDLIASDGKNEFRILLTSPDAEKAEALVDRIAQLGATLASAHHGADIPLVVAVDVQRPDYTTVDVAVGPCDPCDEDELHRLRRRRA